MSFNNGSTVKRPVAGYVFLANVPETWKIFAAMTKHGSLAIFRVGQKSNGLYTRLIKMIRLREKPREIFIIVNEFRQP
jgi:hypothetical protein